MTFTTPHHSILRDLETEPMHQQWPRQWPDHALRYFSRIFPRLKTGRQPEPRLAKGLLTLKQAAHELGCSERTLREHMRAGSIRYIDVGHGQQRRAPRFEKADLEDFKHKHRGQAWRSTSAAKSTITSSNTAVIDFAALRAAKQARSARVRAH